MVPPEEGHQESRPASASASASASATATVAPYDADASKRQALRVLQLKLVQLQLEKLQQRLDEESSTPAAAQETRRGSSSRASGNEVVAWGIPVSALPSSRPGCPAATATPSRQHQQCHGSVAGRSLKWATQPQQQMRPMSSTTSGAGACTGSSSSTSRHASLPPQGLGGCGLPQQRASERQQQLRVQQQLGTSSCVAPKRCGGHAFADRSSLTPAERAERGVTSIFKLMLNGV